MIESFDPYRDDSRTLFGLEKKSAETPLEPTEDHLAREIDVSFGEEVDPMAHVEFRDGRV